MFDITNITIYTINGSRQSFIIFASGNYYPVSGFASRING